MHDQIRALSEAAERAFRKLPAPMILRIFEAMDLILLQKVFTKISQKSFAKIPQKCVLAIVWVNGIQKAYRGRHPEGKLQVFGAVLITGPKGCGKTTTAKQQSASFIEFQDEDRRERYLSVARTMPSKLLEGEHPRLIRQCNEDEKQMPLELPSLKIVITGTEYGYRRDDGVLVIPIACLRGRWA